MSNLTQTDREGYDADDLQAATFPFFTKCPKCGRSRDWGKRCYYCDLGKKIIPARDQTLPCKFCGKAILNRSKTQFIHDYCAEYVYEAKRVCWKATQDLHNILNGSRGDDYVLPSPPNTYHSWDRKTGQRINKSARGMSYLQMLDAIGQHVPEDIVFEWKKCKSCGKRHKLRATRPYRVYFPGYSLQYHYFHTKKGRPPRQVPKGLTQPDYSDDWRRLGYNLYDEEDRH